MRKVSTLLMLLFFCHLLSIGQPCNDRATNGSNFDWTATTYTIYTISNGVQNVASPFYNYSLNNLNTNEFSRYANKDFQVSDGWVLIKKDFGNSVVGTDFPYLMLYNRNTGTLRVFFAFGQLYGQNNAANITLTYKRSSYRSAILGNYAGVGSSLKDFNNNIQPISVNSYYNNSILYWYHADFAMNYDPCVCSQTNALSFIVTLTSNATFQFTINGTALQNLDSYGRGGGNGGVAVSGPITGFYNNVNSITSTLGPLATSVSKWDDLSQGTRDFFNFIGSGISGIGPFIKMANFFLGIFDPSSSAPVKPVSFDINLKASGNSTLTIDYGSILLPIPGASKNTLDPNTLPYYDNALGVFNLLTTPATSEIGVDYYEGGDDGGVGNGAYWAQALFYNLSIPNDIKYIINPNSGLSLDPQYTKLYASYIYKYSDEPIEYQTDNYPLGCFKDYKLYLIEHTYHCDYPAANIDHRLEYIYLKITGKFKSADLTKDIPFTRKYDIQRSAQVWGNYSASDILPAGNCNIFTPPATNAEIAAVCSSTQYIAMSSAYLRTGKVPDSEPKIGLIAKPINKNSLKITPNPVGITPAKITIEMKETGYLKLYIIDATGKKVKDLMNTNNQSKGVFFLDFNMSNLPKGIYLGILETKDERLSQKIIHN